MNECKILALSETIKVILTENDLLCPPVRQVIILLLFRIISIIIHREDFLQ